MKVLMLAGLLALFQVARGVLPDYFVPLTYQLTLRANLNNETDNVFQGNVSITFNTTADMPIGTRNVVLHASNLKVTSIIFGYPSTRRDNITLKNVIYNKTEEIMIIPVLESLEREKSYTLNITYTGAVGTEFGLIRTKIKTNYYLSTRLYPTYSRRLYPCMDEPRFRANYTLEAKILYSGATPLFVSGLNYAISNKNKDEISYVYKSFNPLPTYGILFSTGAYVKRDFINVPSDITNDFPNLLLFRKTSTINSLFGSKDDLKVVIIPGLPVQSESVQGLVALRPDLVTDQSLPVSGNLSFTLRTLTALVKSAYGGVVSPATWNDIWISESVSAYIAKRVLTEIKEWDIKDVDFLQEPLADSWSEKCSPVIPNIKTAKDIANYLDNQVTINKGAAIVNMMESLVSKRLAALIDIVKENKATGASLSSKDFLGYYQNKTDISQNLPSNKNNLFDLMSPWLQETGYPAIKIVRKSKDITASQTRFAYPETANRKNTKWNIPIYLDLWSASGDSSNILKWLTVDQNSELVLVQNVEDSGAVAINSMGSGLFRVLYNDKDLNNTNELLINNVKRLQPATRAAFISDSLIFSRNRNISYSSALQSLNFLNNEDDYIPWQAALKEFDELWNMVYYTDLLRLFKNYATDRIRKTFNALKEVTNQDVGQPTQALLRKLIIGAQCKFDDFNCQEIAKKNFNSNLPRTIYPVIACTVYESETDSKVISEALKKYNVNLERHEKEDLFYYLACPKNNATNLAYLNSLLRTVDADDLLDAFRAAYSKPYNLATSIKFFSDNYETFNNKLKAQHKIVQIVTDFGNKGITDEHISLLQALRYDNDTVVGKAVSASLESMNKRKQFLKDNYNELYAGLTGYGPPPTPTATPTPTPTENPTTSTTPPSTTTERSNAFANLPSAFILLAAAAILSLSSSR